MRIAHLIFAVAVCSVIFAFARDPAGRVFVIGFVAGLGEIALGVAGILALFQTVGHFAEAKTFLDRVSALAATSGVLAIASILMFAVLFAGAWLVSVSV